MATQSVVLSVVATTFAVALRILLLHGVTGRMPGGGARRGRRDRVPDVRGHRASTPRGDDGARLHDQRPGRLVPGRARRLATGADPRGAARHRGRIGAARRRRAGQPVDGLLGRRGRPRARSTTSCRRPPDWVRMRALHNAIPTLAIRGAEPVIDDWLDTAGPGSTRIDDAIVVPVQHASTLLGTLTVSGRLTDVAEFTGDDLTVLQTLAGHLAASLQNARLVETLSYDATHDALTGLANRAQLIGDLAGVGRGRRAAHRRHRPLQGRQRRARATRSPTSCSCSSPTDCAGCFRTRPPWPASAVTSSRSCSPVRMRSRTSLGRAGELSTELSQPLQLRGVTVVGIGQYRQLPPPRWCRSRNCCARPTPRWPSRSRAPTASPCTRRPWTSAGPSGSRWQQTCGSRSNTRRSSSSSISSPRSTCTSGRAHGAEALVRWAHPAHGLIGPDRFIPIAEATGLIAPLTRHVLQLALAECATWDAAGGGDVAVNLSAAAAHRSGRHRDGAGRPAVDRRRGAAGSFSRSPSR